MRAGTVFCAGDFDNDLRPDLAVVSGGKVLISFNGGARKEITVPAAPGFRLIVAVDYDNDGWLDLWAVGEKIRVWRNLGLAGFQEQTAQLALDQFDGNAVSGIAFADFDMDCDSDVVVALAKGGLRYLRNEGGNRHSQVKVRLGGPFQRQRDRLQGRDRDGRAAPGPDGPAARWAGCPTLNSRWGLVLVTPRRTSVDCFPIC